MSSVSGAMPRNTEFPEVSYVDAMRAAYVGTHLQMELG